MSPDPLLSGGVWARAYRQGGYRQRGRTSPGTKLFFDNGVMVNDSLLSANMNFRKTPDERLKCFK